MADMTADYMYNNAIALQQLMENPDIEIKRFPDDVLQLLESITGEIIDEMIAEDPLTARIAASYYGFLDKSAEYQRISDQAYLNARQR